LPPAAGLVVCDCAQARIARATGFTAGIVVLGRPADADEHAAFSAQGTGFADPAASAEDFAASIRAALNLGADGRPEPISPEVNRVRRLIAAGEIACTLQHALNNPLTALMTEIQLLQLDAPNIETRAAAGRMLDLVRRVIDTSRSLDGVRDRPFTI
jgi:signal transduction histidine kinase